MERRGFLKMLGIGAAAAVPGVTLLGNKALVEAEERGWVDAPMEVATTTTSMPALGSRGQLQDVLHAGVKDEGTNYYLDMVFLDKTPTDDWVVGLIDDHHFTATCKEDTYKKRTGWKEVPGQFQPLTKKVQFEIDRLLIVKGFFVASPTAGVLWSTELFSKDAYLTPGDTLTMDTLIMDNLGGTHAFLRI